MSNTRTQFKNCGICREQMPICSPGHLKCSERMLDYGAERALLTMDLSRKGFGPKPVSAQRVSKYPSASSKITSLFRRR
ncbi:MAG: hypothetical protein K2Y01_08855 [Rhabdochlamydiaceae bacterium]|nr:hypothetical protein [Rhabdochlamydiaceae bacterium]